MFHRPTLTDRHAAKATKPASVGVSRCERCSLLPGPILPPDLAPIERIAAAMARQELGRRMG